MLTRRAVLLAIATLAAACDLGLGDDPYRGLNRPSCVAGHARADTAGWCGVPAAAISVDGVTADWDGVAVIPLATTCVVPPCDGLAPATVQLAVTAATSFATPGLVVRVTFPGATLPVVDPDLRYVVHFTALPLGIATGSEMLARGAGEPSYDKNGFDVTADEAVQPEPPYFMRWTADGFEAWVSMLWLTIGGTADVRVFAQRWDGAVWVTVTDAPPLRACWEIDPIDGVADPCAEALP